MKIFLQFKSITSSIYFKSIIKFSKNKYFDYLKYFSLLAIDFILNNLRMYYLPFFRYYYIKFVILKSIGFKITYIFNFKSHCYLKTLDNIPSFEIKISDSENTDIMNKIRLASKEYELNKQIFLKDFDDIEDFYILHRFTWIYYTLASNPTKNNLLFIKENINIWIDIENQIDRKKSFQNYTTCERVVAWLYFYSFTNSELLWTKDEKIRFINSIDKQINMIISNLEFNSKFTNNHIYQNAKSIYIIGCLIKHENLVNIGKYLLLKWHDVFFENGILIEDSTHYQLIYTKVFLEIFLISTYFKDSRISGFYKNILTLSLRNNKSLFSSFSNSSYPLFGDISPDILPDWLNGYPININGISKAKIFNLFESIDKSNDIQNIILKINSSDETNKNGFWFKKNFKNYEVWIITKSNGIRCHGHNDNGSIEIYDHGIHLIFDLGLDSYNTNTYTNFQRSFNSHNIPRLDSIPVDVDSNNPISNIVEKSYLEIINQEVDSLEYKVRYFINSYAITRKISYDDQNRIIITDQPESNMNINLYENLWSFNGYIKREKENIFLLRNSKYSYLIEVQSRDNSVRLNNINYRKSICYGNNIDSSSIFIKANNKQQLSSQTLIITKIND